jgi:hypothetical protein
MAINVYWSVLDNEWLRATVPQEVRKTHFSTDAFQEINIIRCPATRDFLHNYYSLSSIYSYNIFLDSENQKAWSDLYNQNFFDSHVRVRSYKHRIISFIMHYIFFVEEESLLISMHQPFLEDNIINNTCILYPGQFNIGKWFRNLDFAFRLKKSADKFVINEKDIYAYVKFHTDENINFIQFRPSRELRDLANDIGNARQNQPPNTYRPLEYRYESFSTKNLILQEIKKNILT